MMISERKQALHQLTYDNKFRWFQTNTVSLVQQRPISASANARTSNSLIDNLTRHSIKQRPHQAQYTESTNGNMSLLLKVSSLK